MPISDHAYSKNSEITFNFPEIAPACKKSVYSINSFLRHSQFKSCMTTLATSIFDHFQTNIFWSNFNLWVCINMEKIRLLHWFALEIWLIKKPCNLIGWEHFVLYLKNKNFSKRGTYAETHQIIQIFIIEQIQ